MFRVLVRELGFGSFLRFAFLFCLAACGDDVASVNAPLLCERDADAIAASKDCLDDDQCPCGAHCVLGRCEAECMADSDCGDGRCDAFGRCRGAAESAIVPVVGNSAAAGSVVPESSQVVVDPDSGEGTLKFRIADLDSPLVRVMGRSGVEVACDGNTFSEQCELSDVAQGDLVSVRVRRADSMPSDDVGIVRVWSGDSHVSASVVLPEQLLRPETSPQDGPLAGSYIGTGVVTHAGFFVDDDPTTAEATTESLTVPFEVDLWTVGSATILRLRDITHVLAGDGELVASVTLSPEGDGSVSTGSTSLVTEVLVQANPLGDFEPVVLAAYPSLEVRATASPRLLQINITQTFEATGVPTAALWRLQLVRNGETSDPVPTVPTEGATASYDPAVIRNAPTAFEQAAIDTFPTYASLSRAERIERMGYVIDRPLDIAACFDDANGWNNAVAMIEGVLPELDYPTDTLQWRGLPTILQSA